MRIEPSGTRLRVAVCLLLAGVAFSSLAGLTGCSRGPGPGGRLLLVGIDSADWDVIEPLMEQGSMPNLRALMDRGVSCDLRSLEPKQKSPTIWASIATGKVPAKHGILSDVDPISRAPMTSNVRSARTFWDIMGGEGASVTVVGWLVSWPAEEVNGYLVTDYFRFAPKPDRPLPEHLTYPEGLVENVSKKRVVADGITDEDLARLVDFDRALSPEEAQRLPVKEMFEEMRAINEIEHRADRLRDILAGDFSFLGVAGHLMDERPTDLTAVYLRGLDSASHLFWAAAHPGEVGFKVARTDNRVFGKVVERYYQLADEMLGQLVERMDDNDIIVVCSDHGFEGPKPGQRPGGINDHGPVGILVAAGGPFRRGAWIDEQTVLDITPTLLALWGLPVGADMDGSVIEEAFEPDFLDSQPVTSIETYERTETASR
ncbi:MAG: hypothetical protein GF405_00580 [Candidatus Eisenbacteria bacterium]|nr:hypothetical protein [Candidatus Eisenbacteria bacterium]